MKLMGAFLFINSTTAMYHEWLD